MIDRLRPEFYRLVATPGVVGFTIGWVSAASDKRVVSAILWSSLSVVGWLINDLFARSLAGLLHRRRVPLPVLLLAGFFAAAPLSILLNLSFGDLFRLWGIERNGLAAIGAMSLGQIVSSAIAPLLLWLTINLAACRIQGGMLFGYGWFPDARQPPRLEVRPEPKVDAPAFMRKVKPALRGRVIAINAELHYVRVLTERGADLIHYRFRDAVTEMQALGGLQVHRSWCVAGSELTHSSAKSVTMKNGLVVPIGRTYRRIVSSQLQAN